MLSFKTTTSLWVPFKKLIIVYLGLVSIFFLGRLGLFALYYDRITHSNTDYWWTFLYGLRMDTIVASLFLLIPAMILLLLPAMLRIVGDFMLRVYFLVIFLVVIYIENATYPFFAEFDVRPNALFINYLEYPREVLANIWVSYKLEIFISTVMLVLFAFLFWKHSKGFFREVYRIHYGKRVLLFFPLFIILFIGMRSSFQHRPANISDATYTKSHLVNEITKNSLYTIGYAYYTQKTMGFDMSRYGEMPIEEAYQRMGKRLDLDPKSCQVPFARIVPSAFKTDKPKNLVIFIQESLGAQFVGELGGRKGITPNLDRLSKEGLWFTSLYSNGTRSIRGLAALSAGFLPVPGKGVLKRNKSQKDFFTVAQLLKPYGYHSVFIYGGEKRFDNMASWYYGNGFDDIIDEKKFENPNFHGIWGVSDEDLVKRSNQEFQAMHDKKQPFVSVMFSTTNHTPFEFPEGRIELVEGVKKHSVENAIKFADYAVGLFIDEAKTLDYYKDTVFLIASDHNVRVYGDNLLPFDMFRIMGVILGEGIEQKRVDRLTMQPDLLATALDLMGIDNLRHPILGRSIYKDHKKDISLMKFHQMYGLRAGNEIAIIQPEEKPITMRIVDGRLVETAHNDELEKDALGFIIGVNALYQNKQFRPVAVEDCVTK